MPQERTAEPRTPASASASAAAAAMPGFAAWAGRHGRGLSLALAGLSGAALAAGYLVPGGVAEAGATAAASAGVAAGGLGLMAAVGVLAWRSGAQTLVVRAVADLADGRVAPALLEITRTSAKPAADWNRLLARIAAGGGVGGAAGAAGVAAAPSAAPGEDPAAFDAVPHGLVVLGGDGRVTRANGAAARLLRRPRADLLEASVQELFAEEGIAGRASAVAAGLERRGGSAEVPAGPAGESVLRVTLRPLRAAAGGGKRAGQAAAGGGALLLLEDVTQQRAADRARDLFVAQASHELRAPLQNMQLHAERAIDLGTTPGAEAAAERAECLNHVNGEVLRLARLIDEVLSVSQIKAGSLKAASDDVAWATLLPKVVEEHRAAAASREQTLTLDAEPNLPVLQGDREKLSMLLHNLVGNAVKYGRRGGRTVVHAAVAHEVLEVRVVDDGPGVRAEEREKVFEPFFRGTHDAAAGEAQPEGTGLGLPLAAEVAALHEGTLTVSDGDGGVGAAFVLRIPLRGGSPEHRVAGSIGADAADESAPRRAA
ncbi:sensor histidine kinase [Phycisphaera mikurensis]|uniref:histidine kinase n=1 Tax=Phycisphaera mikurensis (strain NBRC 102666 / KCTC 22515 / FYK2301M01) TaxID=1142394 RepID=I0II83_PHYMF|nr:PAS domain-containing sensor histidine kinase [Phycisphaera mikurensis]MBB6442466.1 signal transduction histidine kinase [Phycisphaera mikurensis]BAM04971.1 putative two-component system sensor histidine kinase [Phycisphaera mikurensis NBRC 102666]